MQRTVYGEEHEAFRMTVRKFLSAEAAPYAAEWEKAGETPREYWRRLGELGVLGIQIDERYGGGGERSFKFNAVLAEELNRVHVDYGSLRLHMDLVLPYLLHNTNDEQKARWLPGIASGELLTAIAMTEPGAGSDLAGVSTRAVREGDHYVLNGSKTFISQGATADLLLVVARTSESETDRRRGLSILVVESSSPGVTVGRKLEKIGLKAQDTAELFFEDVLVPADNVLGEEDEAFSILTTNLAQERLSIAIGCLASAVTAVDLTVNYVRERKVFGQPLARFQNTKFWLAECAAEIEACQALVDKALENHDQGTLGVADAAKVKLVCSEMQDRVLDKCLQLHGGYGYMSDYPISKMFVNARVMRIAGGSSEILKTIISKSLGL